LTIIISPKLQYEKLYASGELALHTEKCVSPVNTV
jgi:hypothetical protein